MDKQGKTVLKSINFVSDYIKEISKGLDPEIISEFIDAILGAKRIFLMGAGRSGFEARSFAMRLMHLKFNAYVVGEATTPTPDIGDLVIVISGSGNTEPVANMTKYIARNRCQNIITITSDKDSELGNISRSTIIIPVNPIDINSNFHKCIFPMGTIFEVTIHIFLDAILSALIIITEISEEEMKNRHLLSEYVGTIDYDFGKID